MEERNESSCGKNRDCSKNIWINSQFLALKLCIFLLYYFHYFQKSMARFLLLFFGTFRLFKKYFSSVGQDTELLKFFSYLFFWIFNNKSIIFYFWYWEWNVSFMSIAIQSATKWSIRFCDFRRHKKMPQWFFYDCKISLIFVTLACGFPLTAVYLRRNWLWIQTDLVMSSFELGNLCWIIGVLIKKCEFYLNLVNVLNKQNKLEFVEQAE